MSDSDEQDYYINDVDEDDSDMDDFVNLERNKAIEAEAKAPAPAVGGGDDDMVTFNDDDSSDEEGGGAPPPVVAGPTEEEDGKGWMAVKPYIGALKAPTNAPKNNESAPNANLQVEWVYGYRGYDCRDNVFADSQGRLVYHIASLVVAYDRKSHKQQVFTGHTDDIVSLCQHPSNPDIIATGQVATVGMNGRSVQPHICVTNVKDGTVLKLPVKHKRAVRCVAFSANGKYLASIGADGNNSLIVWDWQSKTKLAEAKGDTNKIMSVEWSNKDPDVLVTTGVKHVFFWKYSGTKLTKKRGSSRPHGIQSFFCHKFLKNGSVISGTKNGALMLWNPANRKASKNVKAHKGAIFAVTALPTGFASGGKDGYVRVFDDKLKEIWSVKLPGRVRSISLDKKSGSLLCGTHKSEIFVLPAAKKTAVPPPALTGHYEGELWALEVGKETFLTAGEDNRVIRWDMKGHKAIGEGQVNPGKPPKVRRKYGVSTTSKFHPSKCARAVTSSAKHGHIAMGRNDGQVVIMDMKSLKTIQTIDLNSRSKRKVRGQMGNWIEAMHYSPCGNLLAVGTHGIVICILDVKDGYKVKKVLKKHNAVITFLDWSVDSRQLRSNCKGYELLFFDIDPKNPAKSKQNTSANALRDVEWANHSCVLSWETQGVWDSDMDGSDVNAVDVLMSAGLVASGDDHGNVNLMRYPVLDSYNKKVRCPGHSSHVTKVRFSQDGTRLVSAGGNDKSVIQWRVV